jgi:serine/threonine protein kinase
MLLPRGDEYLNAVQNPRTAFGDSELKDCTPEVDQFGLPKPYSGGFTATFHLHNQSRDWAVRCFTRAISDLQQRYAAIDHFLTRTREGFLVETFYLSQGIRITGQWYPIIKMQWVKGDTLNGFIGKNVGNVRRIKQLVSEFVALVRRLQQLKIAHGDLQHGNIMVREEKLSLIDYDGMFLPKLARLKTNEIGHPNYQHPGRNASHYGSAIDRFASIAIYVGLRAISESPGLWAKHDDSENILFRAEDFINPAGSAVFRDLSALPALAEDADKFHSVCKLPFDEVPDLNTFISGQFRYARGAVSQVASPPAPLKAVAQAVTPPAPPRPVPQVAPPSAPPKAVPRVAGSPVAAALSAPKTQSQSPPLDGANGDLLRRHVGQRVDVVGMVAQVHTTRKSLRRPYTLLNFGVFPDHTFTVVLRSPVLSAWQSSGLHPQTIIGKWIKVSGVMASYKGKPQMEVDGPAQIQILAGEFAAQQLVGNAVVAAVSRAQQQRSTAPPESVLTKLYGGPPPATSSAQRPPRPGPGAGAFRARTPKAIAPRPRRTSKAAATVWTVILAAVLLGALGWAIWPIWGVVLGQ